jgi:hypothetical protein
LIRWLKPAKAMRAVRAYFVSEQMFPYTSARHGLPTLYGDFCAVTGYMEKKRSFLTS